jgi:hypothetical protein
MRSPVLFALLGLGLASAATAAPAREEVTGRVSYRSIDRGERPEPPREATEWVELADPTPAHNGTTYILVSSDAGAFGVLRIVATTGVVTVRKLEVVYGDGTSRVVPIHMALGTHHRPAVTIDLGDARSIARVVIATAPDTRGTYVLFGATARAADSGPEIVARR